MQAHIEEIVDRICGSPGFRRSARLQRFLRFLASAQTPSGHGPKEYEVAREVYDKPADFDPQIDPIVRVEASRLRLRLLEYYGGPGQKDVFVLELPKGSYSLICKRRGETASSPPEISNARKHYLRGRYLWNKRTTESLDEAIVCFRKALDEDCLDPAAWSGLADTYSVMGSFELMAPNVVFPLAVAAARKALQLNPDSAEAHCSLATAAGMHDWDFERAKVLFDKAVALDPEYASAWHFYGVVLLGQRDWERSQQALERAHSLDPISSIIRVQLASLHYLRRDFHLACKICGELTRLDPDFWPARWFAGMALQQLGRYGEAHRQLGRAVTMSNRSPIPLSAFGHLIGSAGEYEAAHDIIRELVQRRKVGYAPAAAIGLVYLGCGEPSRALEWFNTALKERSPNIALFLPSDPRLDVVRGEPEFCRILERTRGPVATPLP
jgi:tetratricopeptide (TPR) repeat protein